MLVTVFRHVPPPIIGTCGVIQDRAFEAFETLLDWLESTGTFVERIDPRAQPTEVDRHESARQRLSTQGDACLPLVLVNGVVASHGVRPTRTELARLVGRGRRERGRVVARQLAALGAAAAMQCDAEVRRHAADARDLAIGEGCIRAAIEAGVELQRQHAASRADG